MLRSTLFSAILVLGFGISKSADAQSITDPGISTHNYKHPNKAAKAKESATTIRVPTINTIERYGKMRGINHSSSTPKYATRPAGLVIMKTYEKEKVDINPLISSRNYKTAPAGSAAKETELANFQPASRDSIYPNQD
jgi:hypothetical protein